jgi:hypothetical protein
MTTEAMVPSSARLATAGSDYRAFMTCRAEEGLIDVARDQLSAWLRSKKSWDVDVTSDGRHETGQRQLDVRYGTTRGRSLRALLVETGTPSGTWTTELLAHDQPGDGDWLSITVENDQGHFADVPVLARFLMQALPLRDGSLHFIDGPHVFHQHQVDLLIDVLCDEERHGLVFVAGTDDESGLPFQPFVEKIRQWTRHVYGLGQVIVLDPAATRRLQAELGNAHAARPWTIRTYLPGVDPASPVDARRHRVLGTSRLATMPDGAVRKLLGTVARTQAAERPAVPQLQRLRRHFQRLDNLAIVAAIADGTIADEPSSHVTKADPSATPPRTEPVAGVGLSEQVESYLAEIEFVKSVLGVPTLDESTLRGLAARAAVPRTDPDAISRAAEQIKSQQARIETLEDDLAFAKELSDDEQIQQAELQGDLEGARAEIRWLRSRLKDLGDYDAAHTPVPADWSTDYPESFEDLAARLSATNDDVRFTGNPDIAIGLDQHDTLQFVVRMAWDAILALTEYLRARGAGICDKGVDHYLKNTPADYRGMTPGKHAATETAATMNQYGHERVFPVSSEVDASGCTTMTAHFKLGRLGMISPRMYYLDDYVRTGRVYIGYIGPHLTNTQTN